MVLGVRAQDSLAKRSYIAMSSVRAKSREFHPCLRKRVTLFLLKLTRCLCSYLLKTKALLRKVFLKQASETTHPHTPSMKESNRHLHPAINTTIRLRPIAVVADTFGRHISACAATLYEGGLFTSSTLLVANLSPTCNYWEYLMFICSTSCPFASFPCCTI